MDNTRTGTSKAPSKEPMFVEYSGKKLDASANSERSRSEAPSLLHSRDDKACHAQMTTLVSAATSLREQVRQAEWGAFNSVPRHLHGILFLRSSSSSTSPSSENTGEQQTWISPTWIEKHDPSLRRRGQYTRLTHLRTSTVGTQVWVLPLLFRSPPCAQRFCAWHHLA